MRAYECFWPAKTNDVGHDLWCEIVPERQTFIDRLVTAWNMGRGCYVIWPGQTRSIHSTVHLSIPERLWVFIDARSSARKKGLDVAGGRIIDSGYRGELFTILRNNGWLPRVIKQGERYAQAVFLPAVRPYIHHVDEFGLQDRSARGSAGFGSTGR